MSAEYRLAIAAPLWDELVGALDVELETAAILLAGIADDADRPTLTVSRVIWIPKEHYVARSEVGLRIRSQGWMPALKNAATAHLHAIFFHTHPGGRADPSEDDEEVQRRFANSVRNRTGQGVYASLILGGRSTQAEFTGRVVSSEGSIVGISRLRVVGKTLKLLRARDAAGEDGIEDPIHERQVLAFGTAGQRLLADMRVGVVGVGGTGSAVVEQLTRLGVRELVLVDDDRLTAGNISRVYGSTTDDISALKVDVVADHARAIGLGTSIATYPQRLTSESALKALRGCDLIFGCTDDHAGRFNLSRFAFYYLIPVIDLGVVIDSDGDDIRSITGRITYVAPGTACLVCGGVIDLDRVREEGYTREERAQLANEGYARGLDDPDPSVVAYTTIVAAWGVADLLERLFGFGVQDARPEMRLRIADRKMTSLSGVARLDHICGQRNQWGLGDQERFLGQAVWVG